MLVTNASIVTNAARLVSPNLVAMLVTNALVACGVGEDARHERVGDTRHERHT